MICMNEMVRIVRVAKKSPAQQIEAIHQGVPATTLKSMAQYLGLPGVELAKSLRIQPRTLRNRVATGKLNAAESEKSLRLARVIAKSCQVVGNEDKAKAWVLSPNVSLGGKRPIDLLETDIGAEQVHNVLQAIEWGVYL
jgi:putative toxin-antitoxin system antitoxin component (TIGR02293 family)